MVNNGTQETIVVSGKGSPTRRSWRLWTIVGILAAVAAGVAAFRWPQRSQPTRITTADRQPEIDAPRVVNPGYVGPDACAECHAGRVDECRRTNHFRTCRLPEEEQMPDGFAVGTATIATQNPSLRFEMKKSGRDFVQTAILATAAGEWRTTSRIDLVYGAGTADDVYLSWHDDGRMYELPIAWLYPLNQWGAAHFDPHQGGDYARKLSLRCFECHNTWFEHVAGTVNQYRRENFIMGVTCERCHGPGRDHVEFHRKHPEVTEAWSIVHPGRLPRERQLDLCSQCHSNAITHRGPALSYRPGESLNDHYRTINTKHTEDDHVANQVQYLRQSKCFQESDLSCTTCHDPHRSNGPAGPEAVRAACLKCHQPADCHEQDRLSKAVRHNCVGCHMPQYVKINVNFRTQDDDYVPPVRRYQHRIAIYPQAHQEVLLDWHRAQNDESSRREAARLTHELVDHWLAEADRCRESHRYLATVACLREALRISPAASVRRRLEEAVAIQSRLDVDWAQALHLMDERRYSDAIELFQQIVVRRPEDAKARGKLGTLHSILGQREKAVEHLQAVAALDPDDAYGHTMLGWLSFLDGRPEESFNHYCRADEIEPYNAKINYQIGLSLEQMNRLPEALERFRRAHEIDPQLVPQIRRRLEKYRAGGK